MKAPLLAEPIVVRCAEVADAPALLRLHHEGFGSEWTMAQWRWRYVENPLGRTEISGAFTPDGRCLASFCGVPLPCRFGAERGLALRAGDVTVHPALRASIAGPQLLLRTSTHFFETFGGGTTRIVFGFPEAGLTRTIVRHCRNEAMGDVALLVRPVGEPTQEPAAGWSAACSDVVPPDLATLAPEWPADAAGLVRDATYLGWRYQRNPHADCVFVAVRDRGTLRALAVVRESELYPGAVLVLEWLCAADDATSASLLVAVDEQARAWRRTTLVASVSTAADRFRWWQAAGGRVVMTPYQFVCRTWGPGLDRRTWREHWQHSLGDMDFT